MDSVGCTPGRRDSYNTSPHHTRPGHGRSGVGPWCDRKSVKSIIDGCSYHHIIHSWSLFWTRDERFLGLTLGVWLKPPDWLKAGHPKSLANEHPPVLNKIHRGLQTDFNFYSLWQKINDWINWVGNCLQMSRQNWSTLPLSSPGGLRC